jgi:hypothetical protein
MSLDTFRTALASKLGQVVTPEICAWLEENAFDRIDKAIVLTGFEKAQYRGLVFQVERLSNIEAEIHLLHHAHWEETEAHRNGHAMLPDYAAFKADERAGRLVQFTARANGILVGNIRMYVYTSRHDQTLECREDTFYLYPEHRKGFSAIRFWQYMEACMRAIGVRAIYTDSKVVNQVGRLNEYLGYAHVANVFHKRLGE